MGNLAFDISKIVDLNKVVNLDIDKNVDVNVNIDDVLATAEADAEAFGRNALAEVDTFTFANQTGNGCTVEIDLDAMGNAPPLLQIGVAEEVIVDGNIYELPQTIIQDFTGSGGDPDFPTISSLIWTGGLDTNQGIDQVTPIPTPGFAPEGDKVLEYLGNTQVSTPGGSVVILTEYELASSWEVDFGVRDIVCDDVVYTENLSMVIPAGTSYLIEFLDLDGDGDIDAKESEFEAFTGGEAFFEFGDITCPIEAYVQTDSEIINIGLSDWAFEALGTCTFDVTTSEAFAYAESTSALDIPEIIPVTEFI